MTTTALLASSGVDQQVPLASIPTDAASQARVKIRPAVIRAYAQAMTQQIGAGGLRFPAVVLFTDGQHCWLADGCHRVLVAREAGLGEFPADVRSGTERDARLHSISSNTDHGLPRTNADKRKGVTLLLADAEWSQWSDHEIARRCQVSQWLVSRLRKGASERVFQIGPRKVQRGDTVYKMRAKKSSGPQTAPQQFAPTPDAAAPTAWASDRVGISLPSDTAPAFASLSVFAAAEKLHGQLAVLVDQLAQGAGGAGYRHLVFRVKDGKPTFYSPELHVFAQRLISAAPHCGYCPRCHAKHPGRTHPACKLCGGRGWLSK